MALHVGAGSNNISEAGSRLRVGVFIYMEVGALANDIEIHGEQQTARRQPQLLQNEFWEFAVSKEGPRCYALCAELQAYIADCWGCFYCVQAGERSGGEVRCLGL